MLFSLLHYHVNGAFTSCGMKARDGKDPLFSILFKVSRSSKICFAKRYLCEKGAVGLKHVYGWF